LIGLTLEKIQTNAGLREQLISHFPELLPELEKEFDCPDYRDKNFLENVKDLFKRDKTPLEKANRRNEMKKKSFFRRLFGRK
jgi:hypothetical protein